MCTESPCQSINYIKGNYTIKTKIFSYYEAKEDILGKYSESL
jgi:hypothetical protein